MNQATMKNNTCRVEVFPKAVSDLSSRIRNITLLHIGGTVAVFLATIAGYVRIQEVIEKCDEYSEFLPNKLDYIAPLQRSWEYDGGVIYSTGETYLTETLSKVATLLVIETLFVSDTQLRNQDNPEFDNTTAEKTFTEIGDFAKRVNRLRQALVRLKAAVEQGRDIKKLSVSQLRAYGDYLAFHESLIDKGELAKMWTKICKIAALIQFNVKDQKWSKESERVLHKVVLSPRGVEGLKWAEEQLVPQSEEPGDFLSQLEHFATDETGAMSLGILELAGEVDTFTTPRAAAIELSYGFIDQQESNSADISHLVDNLEFVGQESLSVARKELDRRNNLLQTLNKERHVSIPFINVEIPRSQIWFLPLVNLVLLGTLMRLRHKAFELANQLIPYKDEWCLSMDVMPFELIHAIRSWWFWLWQLHYLVLGLFGLFLATIFIYSYPPERGILGWILFSGSLLIAYALTLVIWVRFRYRIDPHPLAQYHLLNLPKNG